MTTEVHQAPVEKIIVPDDRIRKEFKLEKIRNLSMSYQKYGQLQPGVCRHNGDGTIILVAGERRLRACELSGLPYRYTLLEETDSVKLREIELEENLQRESLTWQEEVDAKEELHRLKQGQLGKPIPGRSGGHTIHDTAEYLGESYGKTAGDLELAVYSQHFEEVRDTTKKTDALKAVKRIKADMERREKLGKAIVNEKKNTPKEARGDAPPSVDEQMLYFAKRVIEGKMEEVLPKVEKPADLVIFDPPWGTDQDKVRMKGGGTVDYEDDLVTTIKNLPGWLSLLYEKMSVDSHLYLFFGIVNHEFIYTELERAGFTTNRIPLIWYKQGAHVTRNPTIWPGRSYEPIAYARKGGKPIIKTGAPDVIITPAPSPALKQSHPSAKHPDVLIELIKRSASPGDYVLDPMCGSGMTGVACEVHRGGLQLDFLCIEEKAEFRRLAVINITQGYSKLVSRPVDVGVSFDLPPIPKDFKELEVGSDMWVRFWNEYPDKQTEMLAWKKERSS